MLRSWVKSYSGGLEFRILIIVMLGKSSDVRARRSVLAVDQEFVDIYIYIEREREREREREI